MILAFGRGRSGNLMFQLGGISAFKSTLREKLVLFRFYKLKQIFPSLGDHATLLEFPERFSPLSTLLEKTLNAFASSRLIGSIEEDRHNPTVLVRKTGILPIALFRGGWCQSEQVISTPLLDILYQESVSALTGATTLSDDSNERRVCFVHVRRGDYLNFPSPEHSAALPPCWYREQILRIADQHPGILFRFFSDDIKFVKEEFHDIENSQFIEASNHDSFHLMAAANDGILSASTYSWWAAYFAHTRSHGSFVAPYYWAGWRRKLWHPNEQVKTSFLQYQKVDCARG